MKNPSRPPCDDDRALWLTPSQWEAFEAAGFDMWQFRMVRPASLGLADMLDEANKEKARATSSRRG